MSSLKKHHILSTLAKGEQNRLFTSVFLQSFATSLIGIFVPIYLYQHDFTVTAIILFYLIHYLSCLPIAPVAMFINHRFGIKKSMALGMLLLPLGYYALSGVHGFGAHAVLATILLAWGGTIYHLGYHIELTRSLEFHKEGRGLSFIFMCALVANLSGPLIGAAFIAGVSFHALLGIVALLFVMAAIPLFTSSDYKMPVESYNPFYALRSGNHRQSVIFSAQGAIKTAQDTLWPLFIFLILKNVVSLGALTSASSAIVLVATYYIGKWVDKNNSKTLKAGVVAHISSWNLKLALLTPIGILFTNFLSSLSFSLIENSFNKVVYGGAKQSTTQATYFLYREYTMLLGRIVTLGILLFITNLPAFFVVTSVLGATMLLAIKDVKHLAAPAQV